MKVFRSITIFILLVVIVFPSIDASASSGLWEVGWQMESPARGVTAIISTPSEAPNPMVGDGISNWVSTFEDRDGRAYWAQAGWELVPSLGYSVPYQYVETCQNYDSNEPWRGCQTEYHKWHDVSQSQPWGTQYEYWIYRKPLGGGTT